MPRSVGITISAVVVFLGSAVAILFAAFVVLAGAFVSHSSRMPAQPAFFRPMMFMEAAFVFGFGGWGVASGAGLISTKEWARISMLVYAFILLLVTLPAGLLFAFIPLPDNPNNASVPPGFMTLLRVGMVLFYESFAALGAFWLYFFNKRSVKAQFRRDRTIEAAAQPFAPAEGTPFSPAPATRRARPLSITVIGWFLAACCAVMPMELWLIKVIFPHVEIPFCFLGFFFFGGAAYALILGWTAVQLVAAVGLLKLKNWARLTTIALQFLGLANGALVLVVPGNRAKLEQYMAAMVASMDTTMPQPWAPTFGAWIGMAATVPLILVVLWFLFSQKQAFMPRAAELPGSNS
jgi:hypothetical protein